MKNTLPADGAASDDEPPSLMTLAPAADAVQSPATCSPIAVRGNEGWDDWRWQMKNRIRNVTQLISAFPTLRGQRGLADVARKYPLAITPYYASLIQNADCTDPIFNMAVPQIQEFRNPPFLCEDPLEENQDMPVPGLIHRYGDRALLIATTTCSMYCRHCTRKRVAGTRETSISPLRLQQVVKYLSQHPEVKDVIVSGGDPLTMADETIDRLLAAIRGVPSVEIIRIGTRTPVVMPMRITAELVSILRKYHPLFVNTHFNHPSEITSESAEACARLVDSGIPMGNQSVLLKGVNDDPQLMMTLCRSLVRMRVRPYYLFQCDLVRGVEHFRTPISRGLEIMEFLRGRLSGLAIPSFVVDAPHGGGKIPLLPTYVISQSPTHTVLRNYEGLIVNYPEPRNEDDSDWFGNGQFDHHHLADSSPVLTAANAAECVGGVSDLAAGRSSSIVPQNMGRLQRRRHEKGISESGKRM